MLITPMTPKVTASPMAARISTDPSDRPKNRVSAQPSICRRNSVRARAMRAASRAAGSPSSAAILASGPRISVCICPPSAVAALARTVASSLAKSANANASPNSSLIPPSGSTANRARNGAAPVGSGLRRKASTAALRCWGSALASPRPARRFSIRLRRRLLAVMRSRPRLLVWPSASPLTASSMATSAASFRPITTRSPSSR